MVIERMVLKVWPKGYFSYMYGVLCVTREWISHFNLSELAKVCITKVFLIFEKEHLSSYKVLPELLSYFNISQSQHQGGATLVSSVSVSTKS